MPLVVIGCSPHLVSVIHYLLFTLQAGACSGGIGLGNGVGHCGSGAMSETKLLFFQKLVLSVLWFIRIYLARYYNAVG
jgi:hypothetical protein